MSAAKSPSSHPDPAASPKTGNLPCSLEHASKHRALERAWPGNGKGQASIMASRPGSNGSESTERRLCQSAIPSPTSPFHRDTLVASAALAVAGLPARPRQPIIRFTTTTSAPKSQMPMPNGLEVHKSMASFPPPAFFSAPPALKKCPPCCVRAPRNHDEDLREVAA